MSKKAAANLNIVGLDIGYSNVKVAFGPSSNGLPEEIIRPAQASEIGMLRSFGGLKDGEYRVQVGSEEWAAFIAPGRASMPRELHSDYPSSDVYKALFHAALIAACPDGNVVDVLVTGLPTMQAKDKKLVDALTARLKGIHKVAPQREIEVKDVQVVAQPIGSYVDVYTTHDSGNIFDDSNVLVLDPGYFSVDWVLFNKGDVLRDTCDSSITAMSVMLEQINEAMASALGGQGPGLDKLETALQKGTGTVAMFGKRIELQPYIDEVAPKVARKALQDLKMQMRHAHDLTIDFLILAGGGSSMYESIAREIFPAAEVIRSEKPVTSNARGFWLYGSPEE